MSLTMDTNNTPLAHIQNPALLERLVRRRSYGAKNPSDHPRADNCVILHN